MKIIMSLVFQCIFTFFICFQFTNGRCSKKLFGHETAMINVVDPTCNKSFSTIQAAIDCVPSNNKNWSFIFVKAGVYKEQVKIPSDKPFIYLKGEGMGKTKVVWGAHDTMLTSSTFASMADNILVSGITFVNSYNYPPRKKGNPVKPAVAARISGDKSAFYECSFLGYQDTLLDDKGRHLFKLCTIEGAVDFIFGGGQSIYEQCSISMNGGRGFIAAQARASPEDGGGFVFKQCNVSGKGNNTIFLGRAWKAYSRVIYYHSFFADTVVPQGWDAWTQDGHESRITFVEYECQGPGSDKSKRVKWEKNLCQQELELFINTSYIDSDGWIPKLPSGPALARN